MRSVELHSFYIVYASVKERKRGRLFSRDPANARDVGGFTLVAPPRFFLDSVRNQGVNNIVHSSSVGSNHVIFCIGMITIAHEGHWLVILYHRVVVLTLGHC